MLSLQNEIRHTLFPVATCETHKEPLLSAFSFSEINFLAKSFNSYLQI